MEQKKICLASDNYAPAHPDILKALIEANQGYAPSYGSDPWTAQAEQLIHRAFGATPKVLIVPSGTGANVLALKLLCKRHESVLCSGIAHIHYQESGAVESLVGCKLLTTSHDQGKISPEAIMNVIAKERAFGKHSTSPRVLSITQPTELGTVYTLKELEALAHLCKEEQLLLHMDGSRLYNAAVHLGTSLDAIIKAAQVDILALGGTKNGLLCAEALLIFNPALEEGADHIHKQTLCLVSKMRYLAAQFIPFFEQDLWRTLAMQANQKAQEIAKIITMIPELTLNYPVTTNQLFFSAPAAWVPHIQEHILCYLWDHTKTELRLITSWSTTEQDIKGVKEIFQNLAR